MAKVAQSPTAQNLKSEYLKEADADTLVGADVFDRLANLAARCVNECDGPQKIVAYTLLMFFRSAAYDFSDRPVPSSEASTFQSAFHKPVLKAIEYIQNFDANPTQLEAIGLPIITAHQLLLTEWG